MKRKIIVLLAAVGLVWAGTLLAVPAGAGDGSGFQQTARTELTLPAGVVATLQVCTSPDPADCKLVPIEQPVSSLELKLDYVMSQNTTHLPDVLASAGVAGATCRTGPKAGEKAPGLSLGLSAGDSTRLNKVTIVVLVNGAKAATQTVELPGDNKSDAFGPASVALC